MAAMLEEQYNKNYCIKMKLFSQWKGILLFFSSSMAAANTLYCMDIIWLVSKEHAQKICELPY